MPVLSLGVWFQCRAQRRRPASATSYPHLPSELITNWSLMLLFAPLFFANRDRHACGSKFTCIPQRSCSNKATMLVSHAHYKWLLGGDAIRRIEIEEGTDKSSWWRCRVPGAGSQITHSHKLQRSLAHLRYRECPPSPPSSVPLSPSHLPCICEEDTRSDSATCSYHSIIS